MTEAWFRPERTSLAAVGVLLLGALPFALSSPWLAPGLLLPVGAFVWVLRARVGGSPEELVVCNGLRTLRLTWPQVDAFDVPTHGPVVLRTTSGRRLRLTALTRRDLPALLATAPAPDPGPSV